MLDSAMELITVAASNSHIVFCLCHLIVALLILLVTASPSSSSSSLPFHQRSSQSVSEEITSSNDDETESAPHNCSIEKNEELVEYVEIETATELIDENVESTSDEEEEDDELRRRAEEFIEEVNRRWKAEKLKNYAGRSSWTTETLVPYSLFTPA